MTRGIIAPLNMSFDEAVKKVVKKDSLTDKKRGKLKRRPVRQSASPIRYTSLK